MKPLQRRGNNLQSKQFWAAFLLPPVLCFILDCAIPGGLFNSHNIVIFIIALLLCLFHIFTTSQVCIITTTELS